MSNILQFQQKLNYTKSDFQVRVSVSEEEFTDWYKYTAQFYIKTTARDLTPTTEEKIGELVVNSYDDSGKNQTIIKHFTHSSGKLITVICQCSLDTSGNGSIIITAVNYEQFFDGHLTKDSFIITTHIKDNGIDEGEYYYSYYATVDIKSDLESFFNDKETKTTGYSPSDYGHVNYSTSATFTTNKNEKVTVYLTLSGTGGPNASCNYTVDGISPQWIDAPGRPKLLKYGNKLIKY